MDKIARIRQEIERLKEVQLTRNSIGVITGSGVFINATCLLSFLDTLSEESDKSLEEATENYIAPIENKEGLYYINYCGKDIKDAFIAGAEWAFGQGWTFEAHKGAFGICFDGNIDNLLDSLKDEEEVTVQIRKK